jgi:hypothetical protein
MRLAALALAGCGVHAIAPVPVPVPAAAPAGEIVTGVDVDPDRALLYTTAWSPDGRFVLLPRKSPGNALDSPLALEIVDSHALGAVRIDAPVEPTWAPDGRALVLWADWKISAIDPATGATILSPRATSTFTPEFAPDGRLVWGERTATEDVVHVRDLARGVEDVLRAPARPPPSDPDAGAPVIEHIDFSRDGAIALATAPDDAPSTWGAAATIHVWRGGAREADLDGLASPSPVIDASGAVVLAVADGDDGRLEVLPPGASAPVEMHGGGTCGAGAISHHASIEACAPGRVAVSHGGAVCLWDVGARTLVAEIPTGDAELLGCDGGTLSIGYGEPGSELALYDAVTGKPAGRGSIPVDEAAEHAREKMWIDVTDASAFVVDNRAGTRTALADSARTAESAIAPDRARVLGIDRDGRARIWDARGGQVIWAAPAVPRAAQVAFDARGGLVVAGEDAATWRFGPGARALRTAAAPPECTLRAVAADGDHGIVLCQDWKTRGAKLIVDGGPPRDAPGATALIAGPAGALVLALDGSSLIARGALDDRVRWRAVAPPRDDWAASAAGDRFVWHDGDQLWAADARSVERWHATPRLASGSIAMSPDGALVAVGALCQYGGGYSLWDGATGALLREVKGEGCTGAWDPTSARFAVWRAGAVEVTDARAGTVTRLVPRHVPDRRADSIAWSRDGASLAAAADGVVSLWRLDGPEPVATFAPWRAGVAAILRDGSVELDGDANDARAVLGCRRGARLAPLDACAPRVR